MDKFQESTQGKVGLLYVRRADLYVQRQSWMGSLNQY